MNIAEYLEKSLQTGKPDDLCRGWDYLENNIIPELQEIIKRDEYWALTYNDSKVDYIIKHTKAQLTPEQKKQLGSFVYIYNGKHRDQRKQQEEQNLINQGYQKILSDQKEYDQKKVQAIVKLGMLGDKLEEITGKLIYSTQHNALILLPKRNRTRGLLIRQYCFIKVI